jgi:hypothetical protein
MLHDEAMCLLGPGEVELERRRGLRLDRVGGGGDVETVPAPSRDGRSGTSTADE